MRTCMSVMRRREYVGDSLPEVKSALDDRVDIFPAHYDRAKTVDRTERYLLMTRGFIRPTCTR